MNKTPEKKNRGRPKTLDRQHTIETAMACYWREGVDVFSVNKICHYAQISKPGLYREFGGEDGLMEAVLNHYREVMVKPLLAMLETDRPFAEVLRDLVVWMTEQHETPPGCLFAKMRTSPTRLGPATWQSIPLAEDCVFPHLTDAIFQSNTNWSCCFRFHGTAAPFLSIHAR